MWARMRSFDAVMSGNAGITITIAIDIDMAIGMSGNAGITIIITITIAIYMAIGMSGNAAAPTGSRYGYSYGYSHHD